MVSITDATMVSPSVLSLSNITKSYKDKEVLKDISFELKKEEFVSIIGPSGSGKSTIFNIIAGLQQPTNGTVEIKETVGYMQQKDLLLPWKTILNNIVLPLDLKHEDKKQSREKVIQLMEKVGLKGYENKYPSELSGGMRQRANFLRTFLTSQQILLLDEPFGALDSITKGNMQKWLLNIKEEFHLTILFITHDIEEAIFLSDRIYVLSANDIGIKKEYIIDFESDNKEKRLESQKLLVLKKEILGYL